MYDVQASFVLQSLYRQTRHTGCLHKAGARKCGKNLVFLSFKSFDTVIKKKSELRWTSLSLCMGLPSFPFIRGGEPSPSQGLGGSCHNPAVYFSTAPSWSLNSPPCPLHYKIFTHKNSFLWTPHTHTIPQLPLHSFITCSCQVPTTDSGLSWHGIQRRREWSCFIECVL